ncbi:MULTISPECIES: alpha/beta hydrolase [unclassified Limnobacter]|jgi:acetyl esterase/lipase|uniref:alpha/beta hydrolase n=1 Tax=unclassified Limnobacter TaxID=2630203 RepID=UPI0025C5B6B6|nr:alpha/beta hydrolase [Limnobacter sp. CACIAM 66H1]
MNKSTSHFLRALKVIPLILLGGCSALQVVNSVSKIYTAEVKENIAFGVHPKLKYDLYLPDNANEEFSNTPVIVFFYGGSWNRGDKSEYEFVGRRLASMGYITAVPNYRLYPEVKYPDFLEDGAQSLAHLKKELQKPEYKSLNPAQQYVLMGHSAGAYNAAMLALDPRWLNAVGLEHRTTVKGLIGLAGAYNIYPIKDTDVQPVFDHPNYPPQSQPIDYANKSNVPSLLLAPQSDTLVSIERNTHALQNALASAGNLSKMEKIDGTDHVTLIGTLSPLLFFKGSTVKPIDEFVRELHQQNQQRSAKVVQG